MKFTGTLSWLSARQNGVSKAGNNWEKVEFVVTEAVEKYPNEMLFTAFNDKLQMFQGLNVGDTVDVDYDSHVRDWTDAKGNARKSLELTLYKIQRVGQEGQTTPVPAQLPTQAIPTNQKINFNEQQDDGLPF